MGVRLHGPQEAYHEEILHDAINNVEDLYADGIAFEVMQRLGAVPRDGIGGFFLSWMKAAPEPGHDAREARWRAAHAMLGNARALAQIKAHGSADQVKTASGINGELLARLPTAIANAQPWFQAFLDRLPPSPTEASFTRDLTEYVRRFAAVAEGAPSLGRRIGSKELAGSPRVERRPAKRTSRPGRR